MISIYRNNVYMDWMFLKKIGSEKKGKRFTE